MKMDPAESLRLVAKDETDLEVVSALLQDAIIAGADMHYDEQHDCFMFVANRFCWERPALADVNDSTGGTVRERASPAAEHPESRNPRHPGACRQRLKTKRRIGPPRFEPIWHIINADLITCSINRDVKNILT